MSDEILLCPGTHGEILQGLKFADGSLVIIVKGVPAVDAKTDRQVGESICLNKEMVMNIVMQLVESYKMEPDLVFDQDYLICHVRDNYWEALHGH